MKFISLIDTRSQKVITINADSFVLRLEIDGVSKETRIKPFIACVLYELFHIHPSPLTYDKIITILKEHNLIVSDLTRLHRKLSEIRQCVQQIHLSLGDLILNTRGIGYSLPLRLKNLHQFSNKQNDSKFFNAEIAKAIQIFEELIYDSIDMTAHSNVIKHDQGYVINRALVKEILAEKILRFNECATIILKEIRIHEFDFIGIRISYFLSKLKTYIGLARISEYPISKVQWLDWFTQEIWMLFEELKKLIRDAEKI